MAITRSAKKAHRQSLSKRVLNDRRKDNISRAVKSLKKLIATGNKKEAQEALRKVQTALDKAAKEHTIKKNSASRNKSRLSKLVKKL